MKDLLRRYKIKTRMRALGAWLFLLFTLLIGVISLQLVVWVVLYIGRVLF